MNGEFFGMTEIRKTGASPADMEKINSMTLRTYGADEVFAFTVKLCDNEIDRDFQRFGTDALPRLAELFRGVTGIEDHAPESGRQRSRIYDTEVVTDESRITTCGEPYSYVSAKCYAPRTRENGEFIASLESGMRREVSVGCSVRTVRCSVCGRNRLTEDCGHIRGSEYDGQLCHDILCDPADAYEWSFVAIPAQKSAGVIKSHILRESVTGEIEMNAVRKLCTTSCWCLPERLMRTRINFWPAARSRRRK